MFIRTTEIVLRDLQALGPVRDAWFTLAAHLRRYEPQTVQFDLLVSPEKTLVLLLHERHTHADCLTRHAAHFARFNTVLDQHTTSRIVKHYTEAPELGLDPERVFRSALDSLPPGRTERVLIFGSARNGSDPEHLAAGRRFGELVAEKGWVLIFGGGSGGLMGATARATLAKGGRAIGYVPRPLLRSHEGDTIEKRPGECYIVPDMAVRKAAMMDMSTMIVSLPGGVGTYDELFEAITLYQLGYHKCKIALLNTKGYYDPLIDLLKRTVDAGFMDKKVFGYVLVASTPEELIHGLATWTPAPGEVKLNWSLTREPPKVSAWYHSKL